MQYDFALLANGGQQLDVKGKFFKYVSGTGKIRVRHSGGGSVDLLPGQGVWNLDYTSLTISDRTGAANVGVILAGDFDFHDDRISGTVDVVDGGRARTIANNAFTAGVSMVAAAGEYPITQLWNPVGSGRLLIVSGVTATAASAGSASLRGGLVRLANAFGGATAKKVGGTAGVGLTYYQSVPTASLSAISGYGNFSGKYYPANGQVEFRFVEPVVLNPGAGLLCIGGLGLDIGSFFEFFEDGI